MTRPLKPEPPRVPQPAHWVDGWCDLATALPSDHHGPRPDGVAADLIVLHSISLPPGQYGNGMVQRLFTGQLDWDAHPYFQSIRGMQVSAHFFIARTGQLWQFVSTQRRAWHAGVSQFQDRSNCNDFSIGIELEGLEVEPFESGQYEALTALCLALALQHPITHIAGHEHIAPGRKQDPGSGFDWPQLQAALGWSSACFPHADG